MKTIQQQSTPQRIAVFKANVAWNPLQTCEDGKLGWHIIPNTTDVIVYITVRYHTQGVLRINDEPQLGPRDTSGYILYWIYLGIR
jgi:hypothetical protein